MIPALVSTRIGLTNPNSTIDAAICATCLGECVRAFFAYNTSRSVGQISMRRASASAGMMLLMDWWAANRQLVAHTWPPTRLMRQVEALGHRPGQGATWRAGA